MSCVCMCVCLCVCIILTPKQQVYEAMWREYTVAVKLLKQGTINDGELAGDFQQEVKFMRSLR